MTMTKFQEALPEIIACSSFKQETSYPKIMDSAARYYAKSKDQELIKDVNSFYEFIEGYYLQNQCNWTEEKAYAYFKVMTKFSVSVLFKGSLQYLNQAYREHVKYIAYKYLESKVKVCLDVCQKAKEERVRLNEIPEYVFLNKEKDKIMHGITKPYFAKLKALEVWKISEKLGKFNKQLFTYLNTEQKIYNELGEYCYGSQKEYNFHGSEREVGKFLSDFSECRGYGKLERESGKHWKISIEEEK